MEKKSINFWHGTLDKYYLSLLYSEVVQINILLVHIISLLIEEKN